jgi:hypothetical protein
MIARSKLLDEERKLLDCPNTFEVLLVLIEAFWSLKRFEVSQRIKYAIHFLEVDVTESCECELGSFSLSRRVCYSGEGIFKVPDCYTSVGILASFQGRFQDYRTLIWKFDCTKGNSKGTISQYI